MPGFLSINCPTAARQGLFPNSRLMRSRISPNLHLAVFHRGERVPRILISVNLLSLPVTATESSPRTLVLTTSLLRAGANPRVR